jgi:cyclic beta-1,2-glucan synthetase
MDLARGRRSGLVDNFIAPLARHARKAAPAEQLSRQALWGDLEPLRDALLSAERLEERARELAREQIVADRPLGAAALPRRIDDNARTLSDAYTRLATAAGAGEAVSPAAEWIIDNYHLVERQVRDIRIDLPPGYYRRLPKLASGALRGFPRILGAMWAYLAHSDSHFNPDVLCRFLCAYQQVAPLMIGELWAAPITLRILLLENLRRFAELALLARDARRRADDTADALLAAAVKGTGRLRDLLAEFSDAELTDPFIVQLAQRLRDQDRAVAPALSWLDQRLAFENTNLDEVVQLEQQREINAAITVRNIVTSMRLANDVDWRDMFERVSLVEGTLATNAGYARMDFPTRNLYRSAVEEIARGARRDELDIAQSACAAAAQAPEPISDADARLRDPGHYLIGAGRPWFERAVGYRAPLAAWPERAARALGIGGYIGAGIALSLAIVSVPLVLLTQSGAGWGALALLGLLGAAPAAEAAVALINQALTRGLRATFLPAIEVAEIPKELRTLVAVPTMLSSLEAVAEQTERLEVHYLASPKGEVYFALLTDWTDADAARVEGDGELLDAAVQGIARLNAKHGPGSDGDRFLLFHRKRVWTPSEGKWMGWERKRGKLCELNELLRDAGQDTTFIATSKTPRAPRDVRYVVTLDADTRLTADAIARLIGKMAHPLNAPRFDSERGRVVDGYGVLQPRVTPAMPVGRQATPFLLVFSNLSGIDPYAAAASDVYQDLLGEGSYTGKGIYDVDAFRLALAGRVRPSTMLSHDLFEGVFARSGLVSDIEFVEEFPARYDSAALRHHRWTRGDWQLLPWMLGLARDCNGARTRVTAIGRWKMVDNLRRSVAAPAAVLSLLAGFALLNWPASLGWGAFVLATLGAPALLPVIALLAPRWRRAAVRRDARAALADARVALAQWLLSVIFLAHQAWLMGDAALRTLLRLITRKKLMEWTPAAQARLAARPGLAAYFRYMSGAIVIAAIAPAIGLAARGALDPLACALALLWAASPAIAVWTSLPHPPRERQSLSADEARALSLIARRTWRYFETFVTAEHNWLPPDNYQESPSAIIAQRTSPTNIGLYLLSTAAACDLGWISVKAAAARLKATLTTLQKLARFRGHFFNWYDTRDLRTLDPAYVSSVDSGNLAGHLIAVANACIDWCGQSKTVHKIDLDTIAIAREELSAARSRRLMPSLDWEDGERQLAGIEREAVALASGQPVNTAQIADLAKRAEMLRDTVEAHSLGQPAPASADLLYWLSAVASGLAELERGAIAGEEDDAELVALAAALRKLALGMDFAFLLDRQRLLLAIGYRSADGALDPSCYDLLASEARLASLFAIAKGDAPAKHWFRLSHAVARLPQGRALVSWSGSMFEYLMPSLVMQEPTHSLLEQSNRAVVRAQIAHGRAQNTPWGVSESAYNARDLEFNYQYSNFGVPGLGLKRGLGDNIVISPYATALAAMVWPKAAVRNFGDLASLGARGAFGFYEALDFTPERLPQGKRSEIVRCYMAHHQGMTICALANALCNGLLRARFHAESMIQATELLLQERVPLEIQRPPVLASAHAPALKLEDRGSTHAPRRPSPWSAAPATQLLSNGRYSVMLTAAGAGYSDWSGFALTRWREDATKDEWGAFIYLRDVEDGLAWSPTLQPACRMHDHQVVFDEGKAEFACKANGLATTLEVIVSEEDDAEVRRLTITNSGASPREIEVTSYCELALAPAAADLAHPAFSKLFVEIEHLERTGALLARRRRRDPSEAEFWAGHLAVVEGEAVGQREFETDRAKFLGRCRDVRQPIAAFTGAPLSCTAGASLDPIFSLRRRLRIEPGATARIHFWTVAASTRQQALELLDKHNDAAAFARAEALAWTQAQIELHHMGIDRGDAALFQRLAGHLIYANAAMRPASELIAAGSGEQSLLWTMGVSGDLPIMLVRLSDMHETAIVTEALRAAEYLRTKRLAFDLVIVNERAASYQQDLQNAIEDAVRTSQARPRIGHTPPAGHTLVLRADLVSEPARNALAAAARVILQGDRGRLGDQLRRRPDTTHFGRGPARSREGPPALHTPAPAPELDYFNGLGGFSKDDSEYVIVLGRGQMTPAPWINVIANDAFGFHVSEAGASFVWSQNARERQITPWSNDPVCDPTGQAFYIRDRDSGELFSPTPAPLHEESASFVVRHGRGYSSFERTASGLALRLVEFVAPTDPIKVSRLTITNNSASTRRLSVSAYVEWSLGPSRAACAPHTITARDDTGAILAMNRWSEPFARRTAFADMCGRQESWTGDRREFIGRSGSLSNPAALAVDGPLSGRLGASLDPCAAMMSELELAPGQSEEVVVFLGDAADAEEASSLIKRYRKADLDAVLAAVRTVWTGVVGAVEVKTPDRSFDLMLNNWLIYQTLACRVRARAGFYQASGAYGFRDQLQDVMALAIAAPERTRAHLLTAASRQFGEGDVQHWWLPHTGQGVRTRIADDRVWLAYASAYYVNVTGDGGVLDEAVPFIAGPALSTGQVENFFRAEAAQETATLYEHCARALDSSAELGPHGLPLIGAGDWNDGFNRLGLEGRGESVWLGWFLHTALTQFLPIAEARGDARRASRWRERAAALAASLEREAWDGEWYRRAWHDNGTAIGSAASEECRIDSIAQSWSVLSGAGDPQRARKAMASVERDLIRPQEGVALLFAPPFDRSGLDVGYIKGYPPGVRENGGQYTHGAVWSVMALAALGEGDKAAALFWMLNPVNHARTRTDAHRYRVEPYVMAGDVSSAPGHVGRGGWTWYTGSAGLMYRAGLEYILGLRVEGDHFRIKPCIPRSWPGFTLKVRLRSAIYDITVSNPDLVSHGRARILLDGIELEGDDPLVPVARDGAHQVDVVLG